MSVEHLHVLQIWVILRLVFDVHHVLVDLVDVLVEEGYFCPHPVDREAIYGFREYITQVTFSPVTRQIHFDGRLPRMLLHALLTHELCHYRIGGNRFSLHQGEGVANDSGNNLLHLGLEFIKTCDASQCLCRFQIYRREFLRPG